MNTLDWIPEATVVAMACGFANPDLGCGPDLKEVTSGTECEDNGKFDTYKPCLAKRWVAGADTPNASPLIHRKLQKRISILHSTSLLDQKATPKTLNLDRIIEAVGVLLLPSVGIHIQSIYCHGLRQRMHACLICHQSIQ